MSDAPGGWIAVGRAMLDPEHPLHPRRTGEPACRGFAWLDLVGQARWKPEPDPDGLRRGEVPSSARELAERWNWSKSKAARWLRELEAEGAITWDTGKPDGVGHRGGVITVCDFDTYSPAPAGRGTPVSTPVVGHRWDTVAGHHDDSRGGTPEEPRNKRQRGTPVRRPGSRTVPRETPVQRTGGGTPGGSVENPDCGTPGQGDPWDTVVGHRRRKVEEGRLPEEGNPVPSTAINHPPGVTKPEGEDVEKSVDNPRATNGVVATCRDHARTLIVDVLHLGRETVNVAGYDVGVGLELRQWDAMVGEGRDPEALNGAISMMRHPAVAPLVLPEDMRGEPVTMRWIRTQPEILTILTGEWHKRQ